MKRLRCLLVIMALLPLMCLAQKSDFGYKFYGMVRGNLFYNSRANVEAVDGLFYMFPKDQNLDPNGNDLNATPQGDFYMLYSRLGMDISGPKLGTATTTAKLEVDFRGSGTSYSLIRLRQAYIALGWDANQLLIGQTWHPLFGEVSPSMINLSTGAPFQPFNRSPMIRYRYTNDNITTTAAVIWQMQYNSMGPAGKSHEYIKNSGLPEAFLGIDYHNDQWTAGVGLQAMSLKPRLQSTVDGKTYKVNERVNSFSAEAHVKYKTSKVLAQAKTVYANNLTQCQMIGGFAAIEVDPVTGEASYHPFRHSMTWLNFVYGQKWQPGVFVGYLKNLGTGKPIVGEKYGVGLDIDQLLGVNMQLLYNLPFWKIGAEVSPTIAWYGTMDQHNGRIHDTHTVTNWRLAVLIQYSF